MFYRIVHVKRQNVKYIVLSADQQRDQKEEQSPLARDRKRAKSLRERLIDWERKKQSKRERERADRWRNGQLARRQIQERVGLRRTTRRNWAFAQRIGNVV